MPLSSSAILLTAGVLALFAGIAIATGVIGAAAADRRRMNRSLATINQFSLAPQRRARDLETSFAERVLAPMLSRFVALGRGLSPKDNSGRIQHSLDVAGNPPGWDVDRVLATKALGFAGGLIAGLLVMLVTGMSLAVSLVVVVSLALAGYWAPHAYIYQRGYDRSEQMQRDLPDAIDLLTISVEAGLTFDVALARVAKNTDGPLAAEFSRALQEMTLGMGRMTAVRALGDRTQIPELKSFVTAITQADAFGISIGQVLRVQSNEMRVKRRQRAEERAQKVPVKILFPLIFCIMPTLFVAVLGPGVITMLNTFVGSVH